jgi:hypothetical protein
MNFTMVRADRFLDATAQFLGVPLLSKDRLLRD